LAVIAAALCAAAVLLDPLDMFGGSDLPEAKKPSSESSQQFSDPVQAEGVSVQVPILLYHHISEDTLTQEQFQTEMQLLKDGGYHTVSFDQIFDFVEKGTPLPEKPVCLTFDDGYLSNYEIAYPLLKEYGMKATFFAIGATVGNTEHYKDTEFPITPHYSYEQAKEMSDSGLVSIQSHTFDMHQWAPYEPGDRVRNNILRWKDETEEEYTEALTADFSKSREELEAATGKPVNVLAYPGGQFDALSESVLRSLGVKATLTIQPGKAKLTEGEPECLYLMNRFYVQPDTTEEAFLEWIS